MIRPGRVSTAVLVVFLFLNSAACNKKSRDVPRGSWEQDKVSLSEKTAEGVMSRGKVQTATIAETPGRKIITSWELTIETKNVEEAFFKAYSMAGAAGGWITGTSRRRSDDGRRFADLEMRVPPGKLTGVLEQVRLLGTVAVENSNGQDITEAYYDLEARMKNQKAGEERLLSLLSRRAEKFSDVLDVERELTRVRGEIESMEAKRRNWDILTDTVSLRIQFMEPARAFPAIRRVWDPLRTAVGDALEGFANSLHYLVVFLGVAVPWLALGIAVFFGVRLFWRKRPQGG